MPSVIVPSAFVFCGKNAFLYIVNEVDRRDLKKWGGKAERAPGGAKIGKRGFWNIEFNSKLMNK